MITEIIKAVYFIQEFKFMFFMAQMIVFQKHLN